MTQTRSNSGRLGASFRDPSGFLFTRQGVLYRQVNKIYQEDYELLVGSGLYGRLVKADLLIEHEEVEVEPAESNLVYKILRPEVLDFVSYPYEWSFSQLKDAALTTLAIQKLALGAEMSLKDSSAYNIQFHNGRPLLIDTLSFETYREGEPWIAYRQFCQHFLAPLALMAYTDVRLSQLARVYIDGVPLDLASRLLPSRTRLNPGLGAHIHLHATAQRRYADRTVEKDSVKRSMSRVAMLGLIDSLEGAIRKLRWEKGGTEWGDYYDTSAGHYAPSTFEHKRQFVEQFIDRIQPRSLWDLGANIGVFSRLASQQDIFTVAFDIDPAAVEANYKACVDQKESSLLPLVMDFTNPSPGLGWRGDERLSLIERGPADTIMALALIHHLAVSNNVPLPQLAAFFRQLGKWLVIEFVPKGDPQVKKLLATREDIFPNYNAQTFEAEFGKDFTIHEIIPLHDSLRVMYLMEGR